MPKPIHRAEYAVVRRLLVDLRHKARLKQGEVTDALRKPQPYLSAIETGQRRIDIVELRDLCLALGTTLPAFTRQLEQALEEAKPAARQSRRRVDR